METRHPVEGSSGNEFPSIYNYCGVVAAWSRKTLKKFNSLRFFGKTTPYGKIFKILFQKDSWPHRSARCVQISWNLADEKSVKPCVIYLTKNKISSGSPALATARIGPKICHGLPRQCTQSAPGFIQISSLSAELYPNAWTPSKRAVKCFQYSVEA